jgi:hemoglobin
MNHERTDIETGADIDRLVEAFYAQALTDPIIGFFFTDIAGIDLKKHLPVVSAFWQLQLLGKTGYRGETFAVHKTINRQAALTEDHFHRWLYLFNAAVDELISGPRAEAAKKRANAIARSMRRALAQRHTVEPDLRAGGEAGYFRPARKKH